MISSAFSALPSALRALFGGAAIGLFALAAPGCGEDPALKKGAADAVDPAEQARVEQARKLLAEAGTELDDKHYDKARALLQQAEKLEVESLKFEIEQSLEKVDKRQAKVWANEVDEQLKGKACGEALKQLQEPLESHGEAFAKELRRLVGTDALKCLQGQADEKIGAGAYAEARRLLSTEASEAVLGAAGHKKLSAEVELTIVEALRAQLTADLKARKWAAAVAKIDAMEKRGDATTAQAHELLGAVRDGVGAEIETIVSKTAGARDAAKAIEQIDALIKAVRWKLARGEAADEKAGDDALPAPLLHKRDELAIWAEAQRAGLKPIKKPELRYALGKVALNPPDAFEGATRRDVLHGSKVWVVGTAKNKSLVTVVEPASAALGQVIDKIAGWAPTDRLSHDPTADALLPDSQLVGERVWGPLRPPDGMMELGVVSEVSGREVTVKRIADGAPIKLPRAKLRRGHLPPGTKVITFCTAKDMPAQVVEVPLVGRSAKLRCDGGQEKEEDLASLRTKVELLPPGK